MPSDKPRQRFEDIIDNIDAIARYTAGLNEGTFITNTLMIDAVERCLSRISEAAVKLGERTTELAPEQPWNNIRGLGNRLRHEYDLINPRDIWAIVTSHLPALRAACEKALATFRDSSNDPG